MLAEELLNEQNVLLHVRQHLLTPFLTILERSHRSDRCKQMRVVKFVSRHPLEQRAAQLLVRHNAPRTHDARNVERLRRSAERDATLRSRLRNRCERHMLVAEDSHIRVNLVADDDDVMLRAEVGETAQRVCIPCYARRVVRVGEYEHAALLVSHFRQILKVHRVRSVGVLPKRVVHHLAVIALRRQSERVIHRRLNDNLLVLLHEHVDDEADALHDARYEAHPLLVDAPLMVVLNPFSHRLPVVARQYRVAEQRVFETLAQRVGYKLRRLEVHVRHPKRQQVASAISLCKHLVLQVARTRTVDNLIKIVFHSFLFFRGGCQNSINAG